MLSVVSQVLSISRYDTDAQQQKQQKQPKTSAPSTPSSLASSSSSSSFFFSSPSPQGKAKKPYLKLKVSRDKVQISNPILVEKNGGLTRTKSLEDVLTSNSSRESSPQRLGSPQCERKASPARVPVLPPVPISGGGGSGSGGGGGGKGKGLGDHQPSESRGFMSVLKSKQGKVKTGKLKRNSEVQIPHHVLQSNSPPPGPSTEHRSITHTTSVPIQPPLCLQGGGGRVVKESSVHLATYVALSNYQSQQMGCLSVQAGDKCVLLKKTADGWWLVNIGGREGWTPESCWKEEAWVSKDYLLP